MFFFFFTCMLSEAHNLFIKTSEFAFREHKFRKTSSLVIYYVSVFQQCGISQEVIRVLLFILYIYNISINRGERVSEGPEIISESDWTLDIFRFYIYMQQQNHSCFFFNASNNMNTVCIKHVVKNHICFLLFVFLWHPFSHECMRLMEIIPRHSSRLTIYIT